MATIPADHVYVRHLRWPGDGVVHLGDPAGEPWWPPERLDADWVRANADRFDVFHLHFGFDLASPADLHELADALAERAKPLVYTVHDLVNPHQPDPARHQAQIGALVARADALVTLTETAAGQIEARWGRDAVVLPHPHVVPLPQVGLRSGPRTGAPTIGVHYKSYRPNMIGPEVIDVLVVAAEAHGVRLRFDLHERLLTENRPEVAELWRAVRSAERSPAVEVHVHPFFTDAELFAYLASLSVSVLPYRFGTHSGWLEACGDVGTPVVAPDCGGYGDQGDVDLFHVDADGRLDGPSLAQAVATALDRPHATWTRPARRAQRHAVSDAHRCLYTDLLAAR